MERMTIKQLADHLGISKTAVRKHLTEEFRAAHVQTGANGVITIDPEGCELIAESFRKSQETTANKSAETSENQVSVDVIAALMEQLKVKDEQIAQLNARLAEVTASLQAAQLLHATEQQLLTDGQPQKIKWWPFRKK